MKINILKIYPRIWLDERKAKTYYGKQVDIENSTKCTSIATDFNDFETFIDTIRK